jgi:hypothetical protein
MRQFFVEPAETLMFGQPRSFAAGEGHHSRSVFPPSPFTFQGLIRTRLLHGARPAIDLEASASREEIASLIGPPDHLPRGWQITGPYPAQRRRGENNDDVWIEPWVPAPRFLLRTERGEILPARPTSRAHTSLSDLGENPVLFGRPEKGAFRALSGWVAPAALKQALTLADHEGALAWAEGQWTHEALPPFVCQEFQPGLAIDRGRATASHGLLYFLEALRFSTGSGLLGGFSASLPDRLDARALEEGADLFGRKGRLVSFHEADGLDPDWENIMAGRHLPEEVSEEDCFWLVALTPVRLENALRLSPREALPGGVRLETLAALTAPPLALGGFSLAESRARPNRLYVPAGSTWAVRLAGADPAARAAALRVLNNRHPFGDAEEAAMGFGHMVAGRGPSLIGE